jgi:hypothetical protein
MVADVTSDQIDWASTLAVNAHPSFDQEREIRLKLGVPVKLLSYKNLGESLNEVKLHGRDNTLFDVYKNPSWEFLKEKIKNGPERNKDIRCYILDDKTALFWFSYYATHHYVVTELGYDFKSQNGFFIYLSGPKFVTSFSMFNHESVESIKRVLNTTVLKHMWMNDPDVVTDWNGTGVNKLVPVRSFMSDPGLAKVTEIRYISNEMNTVAINEARLTAPNGEPFTVYKNLPWPSLESLFSAGKSSNEGIGHALRGLVDGNDVYWWYALNSTHDYVAHELLGHPARLIDCVVIEHRYQVDKPVLVIDNTEILTNPQLRKLFWQRRQRTFGVYWSWSH